MERAYPGFVAFAPTAAGLFSQNPVDIGQLIQALNTVADPGPASPPSFPSGQLTQKSNGRLKTHWDQLAARFSLSALGITIGAIWFHFSEYGAALGLGLLALSLWYAFQTPSTLTQLQAECEAAKKAWDTSLSGWLHVAGNQPFLLAKAEAQSLVKRFNELPVVERHRLAELDLKRRENQLRAFLEGFPIEQVTIKGIGTARKITLRSYGIETAADIDPSRIRQISGFGQRMVDSLMGWKRAVESKFVFNPTKASDPTEVAAVRNEIQRESASIEASLRVSVAKVQKASADAILFRGNVDNALLPVWEAVQEAQASSALFVGLRRKWLSLSTALAVILVTFLGLVRGHGNQVAKVEPQGTGSQAISVDSRSPPMIQKQMGAGDTNAKSREGDSPASSNQDRGATPRANSVLYGAQPKTENAAPKSGAEVPPSQASSLPALPPPVEIASAPRGAAMPTPDATGGSTQPADQALPKRDLAQPTAPKLEADVTTARPPTLPPLPPPVEVTSAPGSATSLNQATAQPLISLLDQEQAARVQARLIELGFLGGVPDGVWGGRSRAGLRAFKAANQLGADDNWEIAVQEKLFSPSAVTAHGASPSPTAAAAWNPTVFAPPPGATKHPLNRDDALWIQERLKALGFYIGDGAGTWGAASRQALKDFRVANGLPARDEWDAATEEALGRGSSPYADDTFVGVWAENPEWCERRPIDINSSRAVNNAGSCIFDSVAKDGPSWRVSASCTVDRQTWHANIRLSVRGKELMWMSEKGVTAYTRCIRPAQSDP